MFSPWLYVYDADTILNNPTKDLAYFVILSHLITDHQILLEKYVARLTWFINPLSASVALM